MHRVIVLRFVVMIDQVFILTFPSLTKVNKSIKRHCKFPCSRETTEHGVTTLKLPHNEFVLGKEEMGPRRLARPPCLCCFSPAQDMREVIRSAPAKAVHTLRLGLPLCSGVCSLLFIRRKPDRGTMCFLCFSFFFLKK